MIHFLYMVRLNKTSLYSKQIQDLLLQLAKVTAPKEAAHAHAILSELLGTEEQIMLAKRLAAIVLLAEGYSSYKISRTLKLSKSTIATISFKMERGDYKAVLKTLGKDKKDYFAILKALDDILHLGGILPHYNGLSRYKRF